MFAASAITSREKELHCTFVREQSVKAVPMHWHNEYEITYAEKNGFRILIDGSEYEVPEGQAVIIRPGEKHFYFSSSESTIGTVMFTLPEDSEDIAGRLSGMDRFTAGWTAEDAAILKSTFAIMAQVSGNPDAMVYSLRMRACIYGLASMFADRSVNSETKAADADGQNTKIMARLEAVLRYISENYGQPLTLPQVAAVAGYVPTYFSRVFKECTGLTFYEYLTSYRLAMSEKLLAEGEHRSIVDIAADAGFGSVKTFDRVFKAKKGISPLKYRKRCLAAARK